MSQLLPWQLDAWNRTRAQAVENKLPHGLLLSGPADSGKSEFVDQLARYLLCAEPDDEACGECSQCLLIEAGTHPDYLTVTLEDSKQIRIEQIRDMIQWAQQTAQQGGGKVCVISPADKLNVQSSSTFTQRNTARSFTCCWLDTSSSSLCTHTELTRVTLSSHV